MKKGDIIIGATPQELLDSGFICHKWIKPFEVLCGAKNSLSHEEWDKVTCEKCFFIAGLRNEHRAKDH